MHTGDTLQLDKKTQGNRSTSGTLALLQIPKVLPRKEVAEWLE